MYVYLALRSGLRGFTPAFTEPVILGSIDQRLTHFGYGAITLFGAVFQTASPMKQLCNSVVDLTLDLSSPTTPTMQRRQAYTQQV